MKKIDGDRYPDKGFKNVRDLQRRHSIMIIGRLSRPAAKFGCLRSEQADGEYELKRTLQRISSLNLKKTDKLESSYFDDDHDTESDSSSSYISAQENDFSSLQNGTPTGKMTEQALDDHPNTELDVGSCSTEKHDPEQLSREKSPSPFSQSTSLFTVFEKRVSELRKADEDNLLASDDDIYKLKRTRTTSRGTFMSKIHRYGGGRRSLSRFEKTPKTNSQRSLKRLWTVYGNRFPAARSSKYPRLQISFRNQDKKKKDDVLVSKSSSNQPKPTGPVASSGQKSPISGRLGRQKTFFHRKNNTAKKVESYDSGFLSGDEPLSRSGKKVSSSRRISFQKSDNQANLSDSFSSESTLIDDGLIAKDLHLKDSDSDIIESIIDSYAEAREPLIEQMGDNCKRLLIAADVSILLTLLINPSIEDCYSNFTRDFLLTYRYFMSEWEFWAALKTRFMEWSEKASGLQNDKGYTSQSENRIGRPWILSESDALPILLRIINVMQLWIQEYCYLATEGKSDSIVRTVDDGDEAHVVNLYVVQDFVQKNLAHHPLKQVRMCYGPIKQILHQVFVSHGLSDTASVRSSRSHFSSKSTETLENYVPNSSLSNSGESILSSSADSLSTTASYISARTSSTLTDQIQKLAKRNPNSRRTNASLLSMNPESLFKQLTLIELNYFKEIRPLDLYFKTKGQLQKAPNLFALIERFNFVSYWVATEICMCRSAKSRANVIKLFIKVAKMCFDWRNYSTCLQIVAALSMTCVKRLKKTWKLLPRKHEATYRYLSTMFSASCNYSTYRQDILAKLDSDLRNNKKTGPSSFTGGIPFMGIHLSDLVFIEEAHKDDIIPNGMVNFTKMRLIAESFRQFTDLQKTASYPFSVENYTQRFLKYDVFALDEDKLWKASRICEPPPNIFDPLEPGY